MSKFITLVRQTRAKLGDEIVVQGEEIAVHVRHLQGFG